ncbi:hypothetical protein M0R45_025853 [Rubus argutus]|uniref:Uncharacterized protein n=1 Tax=Rubus argutus TaxID=59490 RepID=A0AAW1WV80_RUBAR
MWPESLSLFLSSSSPPHIAESTTSGGRHGQRRGPGSDGSGAARLVCRLVALATVRGRAGGVAAWTGLMFELVVSGIESLTTGSRDPKRHDLSGLGSDDIDASVLMMGTCDFELQTEEVSKVVMVMMFRGDREIGYEGSDGDFGLWMPWLLCRFCDWNIARMKKLPWWNCSGGGIEICHECVEYWLRVVKMLWV